MFVKTFKNRESYQNDKGNKIVMTTTRSCQHIMSIYTCARGFLQLFYCAFYGLDKMLASIIQRTRKCCKLYNLICHRFILTFLTLLHHFLKCFIVTNDHENLSFPC